MSAAVIAFPTAEKHPTPVMKEKATYPAGGRTVAVLNYANEIVVFSAPAVALRRIRKCVDTLEKVEPGGCPLHARRGLHAFDGRVSDAGPCEQSVMTSLGAWLAVLAAL